MILNSSQKKIQLENIIAETALVAMIQNELAEIGRINQLEFKESYDSLDYLVYVVLPLSLGNQVALVRHKHSPDPGTEICVRHDQKDIARIISEALYELGLDRDAVTWIIPKYEKQLYELLEEQNEHKKLLCKHIGYSNLSEFDLTKHLAGEDLSGLHLKRVQLGQSNLIKTKFIKSELGFANLHRANLEEANLQEVDLRSANLQRAVLQNAYLKGSYLQESDLQGANLEHANLEGADLRGANLEHANLKGADLRGANLERANLRSADLSIAKLNDSTFLKGADIGDATLKDIKWDKDTMWFNIIGLHKAIGIPDNLRRHPNFKLGIKLSQAIEELSENRNLEEFRSIYKEVLVDDIKDKEIAASLWNKIAWLSCLYDHPDEESYQAALKAIKLVDSKGNYHDTLGLILSLRGEYNLAIHEFEIALKSQDVQHWLSDFKERRKCWIEDLKSGKNPFDRDVIQVLRVEER